MEQLVARDRVILVLLESPDLALPHLLTSSSILNSNKSNNCFVDTLTRSYREKVDPGAKWPKAVIRVNRMRRRYRKEAKFWVKYLSSSEYFWKKYVKNREIEVYLCYIEEIDSAARKEVGGETKRDEKDEGDGTKECDHSVGGDEMEKS